MKTKQLTFSALLIAIGVLSSHLIYIPIGPSKCFPVQHAINVISAITLGPWYALGNAFLISLLRNILGTGSILAFPGSMIGALFAGVLYKKFSNMLIALTGEILGTGLIGALAAYPLAKIILGKNIPLFFFVTPFAISTIGGSIIAYALLIGLNKSKILKNIHI